MPWSGLTIWHSFPNGLRVPVDSRIENTLSWAVIHTLRLSKWLIFSALHGGFRDTWFLSECVENNDLILSLPWLPGLALTSLKSSCVSSSVTTWFKGQSVLNCLRIEDNENQQFNFCFLCYQWFIFIKPDWEDRYRSKEEKQCCHL